MKKVLLSAGLALCAMASFAQGIPAVGANIVVLPSTQWSKAAWKAQTLVVNSYQDYGDWQPGYYDDRFMDDEERYMTGNINYNFLCYGDETDIPGTFLEDANGNKWYEPAYNTASIEPIENTNFYDDENPDSIVYIKWEEHQAPFSSDAVYKDLPSYQWCGSSQMADIFIRRTFTTDKLLSGDVYLACGHDDAPAEFYINGVLVFQKTGYELNDNGSIKNGWNNDEFIKLTDEQKALIKLGGEENLIAIHVHQNWGGAFADCGLYTMVEGGLPMGYIEAWEGKVLFNSWGGGWNGGPAEFLFGPWEKLYEAQPGDVYSFNLGSKVDEEEWAKQLHFKTPITLSAEKDYTLTMTVNVSAAIEDPIVKVCENDNDETDIEMYESSYNEGDNEVSISISGADIQNMKIAMDFGGMTKDSIDVKISNISLVDESGKELWVGTSYFNYMYNKETYPVYDIDEETGDTLDVYYDTRQCKIFDIAGRVETKSWLDPDYDDSMWDTKTMPIGNKNYAGGIENSVWPGHMGHTDYEGDGDDGRNTNLWVRRTFTLDKINERLSYALNVCHDDTYECYVNGHLLQAYDGWTDGKNPKQVHIPAKYLNVGKNVIATYIQQNWGGRFYDCGINVEEVNYDECANLLKDAIALAEKDTILTSAMKADLAKLADEGRYELETNLDAAEIKEYARVMTENVNKIRNYSGDVQVVLNTIPFVKAEDNGFMGYAKAAVADAEANADTCHTADQINVFRKNLRVARKRNAAERRTEKYVGLSLDELELYQDVYLYNVGWRQFLKGTESWGAHAGLGYASNAFTLDEDKEGEGYETPNTFRIDTHRSNGGDNHYLNWGGYTDTDTNDGWQFVPVEGKTNVFNIIRAGKIQDATGKPFYLGLRDGDNQNSVGSHNQFNVVDTDMRTAELETNQWMLITPEEMNSFAAAATKESPADLTHIIVNPCFDQRLPIDYWMHDAERGNVQSEGRGNDRVDLAFEGFNTGSYYELYQDIYDDEMIQPGWYSLYVQAIYRDGGYPTEAENKVKGGDIYRCGYVFASWNEDMPEENEALQQIWNISDMANQSPGLGRLDDTKTVRFADACYQLSEEYFQMGMYWNRLDFEIPADATPGYLRIGVKKILAEGQEEFKDFDWLVCDNFRLKYYGSNQPDPDGIESIEEQLNKTNDMKVYNLAGQRIARAQKGVNIINGKKFVVK